jgi:hypothetical protein
MYFPNYAGKNDVDEKISKELEIAGIKSTKMPEFFRERHEVKTIIVGELYGWYFERAWYYWMARGPGIPSDIATTLHEKFGREVRVAGHCGCPSPLEWYHGFAVGNYHVDTQEGLKALADVIKSVYIE